VSIIASTPEPQSLQAESSPKEQGCNETRYKRACLYR